MSNTSAAPCINIMIDIETLGLEPRSVIGSIAAVPFATAFPIDSFYEKASVASSLHIGCKVSESTRDWWSKQSQELYEEAFGGVEDIQQVIRHLTGYIKSLPGEPQVWANGAAFDIPLLEAVYDLCALTVPWKYSNVRCYRTLKELYPHIKAVTIPGATKHNALADAMYQARHAERILSFIRTKGT